MTENSKLIECMANFANFLYIFCKKKTHKHAYCILHYILYYSGCQFEQQLHPQKLLKLTFSTKILAKDGMKNSDPESCATEILCSILTKFSTFCLVSRISQKQVYKAHLPH